LKNEEGDVRMNNEDDMLTIKIIRIKGGIEDRIP
jgi:hypothetical protein